MRVSAEREELGDWGGTRVQLKEKKNYSEEAIKQEQEMRRRTGLIEISGKEPRFGCTLLAVKWRFLRETHMNIAVISGGGLWSMHLCVY